MPKYDGPTPVPAASPALAGAWASGTVQPLCATPVPASGGSGLAGGTAANKGSGGPNDMAAAGTAARPVSTDGDLAAALDRLAATVASQGAAAAEQQRATQSLFEHLADRLDRVESRAPSRLGSDAEYGSDDSDSSDRSSSGSERPAQYLQVDAEQNRHWKAAERALDADQRPRRHSLYGYEPFDLLSAGKHKGGGTLGLVMRYVEPTCLYLQTALDGVRAAADAVESGVEPDELADHLHACANSLQGVYGLANTLRTLIVERSRVTSKSASAADKKRQQWVESQLDEDDFASADVAPRIRRLKAQYDYEAGKADLRKLASGGGATGSGGGGQDRERDKKSKKSRRRTSRRAANDEESDGSSSRRSRSSTKSGGKPIKSDGKSSKEKFEKPAISKASSAESRGSGSKTSQRGDVGRGGGKGELPKRKGGGGGGKARHGGRDGRGSRRNSDGERSGGSGRGSGSSSDSDDF